ncbi:two-component system chemotaxis sensor kinase CheA [Humitalea rosea]|uniref:Chemotaxis protein CheA n=1 Tax=Humitalea rosea TaxID=990373 RepID=A0A2W7INL8_9PROT|nr:ATP-binding protein [Humitalea rosea]PZW49099.1 two-component system chemotaxis sensor kinase CheA [Humitalea rosea]
MIAADDPLWAEFAAESEEHLDTLDRLLSAGAGGLGADGINRLFRAMHSLKGMSDALGAAGMTRLAHVSEDLLGQIRSGRRALDPEAGDALRAAVDTLRGQRAAVLGRDSERPAPGALLDRLAALVAGEAPVGAAPAVRAIPEANPMLASMAQRLAEALPLLGAGDALPLLRDLAEAADIAGLPGLRDGLRAVAVGTPAALPALGRLRRIIAVLNEVAGLPAPGAIADPALLAPWLAPVLAAGGVGLAPALLADAAACASACGAEDVEAALLALQDLLERGAEADTAAVLATMRPSLLARIATAEALPPPEALPDDPRLPPAFLPVLGPAGRARVLAALEAGQTLFRLRLALGADALAEAAVAEAISTHGEIIASHPLPEAGLLDLLIASGAGLDPLSRAATAADPARRVVLALGPIGEERPPTSTDLTSTMRVRQEVIDGIITLEAEVRAAAMAVEEAIAEGGARADLARLNVLGQRLPTGPAREAASAADRLRRFLDGLEGAEQRLGLALRRLDDAVMDLRVLPIGTLFARLPRVVRAVAEAGAKQVDLAIEGEEVTLDRGLVELLADPLLHLTRNAVDHGIEAPAERLAAGKPARAVLRISAARRSGQVRLRVSDDGRGIDTDAVFARAVERGLLTAAEAAAGTATEAHALLFRPGFSTMRQVTETSGRGVGLDVVQDAVRRAGGSLEVASQAGQGTSFTLRLPLTAALAPVLLVQVGGQPCAIPAGRVEAVSAAADTELPVIDLAPLLGLIRRGEGEIVAVTVRGRKLGLLVDRVQRRTDMLLRPLHPALAALPGVGGVGVLGNGEPVLVIEPDGVVEA